MRGANGKRIGAALMAVICCLAVLAEDIVFMANRRRWEALPTATLMQMGNDFINVKNLPDSAVLCYSLIANRYGDNLPEDELRQCIRAIAHTGTIYLSVYHNQADAYRQLLRAKELAEKHNYRQYMPDILMAIGNLYWTQEGLEHDEQSWKEALAYHKAAFWQAVESKSYKMLPNIIINLNFIAFTEGELAQCARERATYATLSIPDNAELRDLAQAMNKGVEELERGHAAQALATFRQAQEGDIGKTANTKAGMRIMLNEYIYHAQMRLGMQDYALNTLLQSRELASSLREKSTLMPGLYGRLSEYYRARGNQALADRYELMWYRTADSVAHASQAGKVGTVRFLHEIEQMNEEQKELATKQRQDRMLLWVVSGFLALALGLVALLVASRHRIKRKNKVLYENNLALLAADEQRRRQQKEAEQARAEAESAKYGAIKMDENTTTELWQNIVHVMEYSQDIYDENFSVARLAELIGAKPNYVSQAINQQQEWTFPTLLAHYRIREACRRINDRDAYGNYTIEAIGQSVGFKSRSYFVKLFKKQTGLTPSDYLKMAHQSGN